MRERERLICLARSICKGCPLFNHQLSWVISNTQVLLLFKSQTAIYKILRNIYFILAYFVAYIW